MRDNGNTGPALGSEAVDAQFWALICDDEEWLRTEFDGIVSEPAEHPTSPPPATGIAVDQDRPTGSARRTGHSVGAVSEALAGRSEPRQASLEGYLEVASEHARVSLERAGIGAPAEQVSCLRLYLDRG